MNLIKPELIKQQRREVTADKEQYDSRLYHLADDLPSGTVAADRKSYILAL
ncbi:MAG: hypothetical protein ACLS9K_14160 [Lachnospira eligens]